MSVVWWCCSTAERRLYSAGSVNKNASTLNNGVNYGGDVELMSLRGYDADCDQLKPHHHHHHHATDCCSYSHVWPVMTTTTARPLSTNTPRRYLGFDVQSEHHCENVEHTYRSVQPTSNHSPFALLSRGTSPLVIIHVTT